MKTNTLPHGRTSFPSASAGGAPTSPANLFIVDDAYLMQHYRLTKGFLNQHARRMGSFSKPRRFILAHVESHLRALADISMQKSGAERVSQELKKIELKKHLNQIVDMRRAADEIARRKAKGILK